MSITESFGYSGMMSITDSNGYYNLPFVDVTAPDELELWLKWERWRKAAAKGIKALLAWHARELQPWLLIAKRFDFRQAPRWSSKRWRSKT